MADACPQAIFGTSSAVITAIIGCLAAQPYWQQRIALELSGVDAAGDDIREHCRCPSVQAFTKEVLRFFPVVVHCELLSGILCSLTAADHLPLVPRMASQDFEANGVIVPAGTKVLHETWAIK